MIPRAPTCIIENVAPLVDGGRYPIKRAVGEDVHIEADIFKDGHDIISAVLKWRRVGAAKWHETPMAPLPSGNDRWGGTFSVFENAPYEFTIEAWSNTFLTWQHEFHAKFAAHQPDLTSETLEGAGVVEKSSQIAGEAGQKRDQQTLQELARSIREGSPEDVNAIGHSSELEALMAAYADRSEATQFILNLAPIPEIVSGSLPAPAISAIAVQKKSRTKKAATPTLNSPVFSPKYPRVLVDRERAIFSQWYEFFPRNAEGRGDRGSTFRDCLPRVDDAIAMGFDVIYFPPIHPIGVTARKGRNNSVTAEPGEPGVPYAIGNRAQGVNGGGHKDVAPELGTLEDFDWLVGEIKKYQDVYPLNFHNANWRMLWDELTDVILFWAKREVRIFRVDNPHTKPVAFWEYLITKVQEQYPDVIFLSEAFTRPKMMKALAKAGYTHSYTYFTWRNTKEGLTEYFTELTQSESAEYMRPNLWPNTPDILPSYLQFGGRPAFVVRAVLAATLAPVYGIYSGFELCENEGLKKEQWDAAGDVRQFLKLCDTDYKQLAKEEYLDSEKYQWRERDWNAPGNIKEVITRLNWIRRKHHAFQQLRNLEFGKAENDLVLYYIKKTASLGEIFLIIVSLDPFHPQSSFIDVPVHEFGWLEGDQYQLHDLLNDDRYLWRGTRNWVRLEPHTKPAHIFRIRRWQGKDQDFEHFR